MKRVLYFVLHVILPVALGTAIYIGWRDRGMLVFRWIEAVGAEWVLFKGPFPITGWAEFALPDGCWVYAYTAWMLLVWQRMNLWVASGMIMAVVAEFGQLQVFGLVPGTFDPFDVACYLGGFLFAWISWLAYTLPNGFGVYSYTTLILLVEMWRLVGRTLVPYDILDVVGSLGGFLILWVYYAQTAPVVGGGGGDHGGPGDGQRARRDDQRRGHPAAADGYDGDQAVRPVIPAAGDTART